MSTEDFWIPKMEELLRVGLSEQESESFIALCKGYANDHRSLKETLDNTPNLIQPPFPQLLKHLEELPDLDESKLQQLLSKVVVLKLNGGIGTTMGLDIPRCALPLTANKTFLDTIVRQIEYLNKRFKVNIPLVLMNSVHTHQIVLKLVEAYHSFSVQIYTFLQSNYPRLNQITSSVVPKKPYSGDNEMNWYPPGSGDVFESFHRSGLLKRFLDEGKEYVFISNVENLGAILGRDRFRVLHEVFTTRLDFYLEVTERQSTDFRGGILATDPTQNNPFVVQLSQIPKNKRFHFSPKLFKYWNTNNMWVSLTALLSLLESSSLKLPVSKNIKNGFIQFETYAGSAIQEFKRSEALVVPRMRFRELKTTSNLFCLQSNLFTLADGCFLMSNEKRASQGFTELPIVRFDVEKFGTLDDYKKRFPSVPNILELEHLNVAGDVTFGYNVKLLGTVIIVAEDCKSIKIPDGAVLENCVISGELQIVDH